MKQRLLNILLPIDMLAYMLLTLGTGAVGETVSGAAWRLEQAGRVQGRIFRPLIDMLFFFDRDHCAKSYLGDKARAKIIKEI